MYKLVLTMLLTACFALTPQVGLPQAQDDDSADMPMMGYGGGGMMGGMGGMGGCGMWGLSQLNLNPDQTNKINKIHDDLAKQKWALQGKILDERSKLRDLYQAEPLDAKKITSEYDTIFNIRKQMIEAQINAMNQTRSLLTPEQQQQLKQYSGKCGGPMAGMGRGQYGMGSHGGMGGMMGGPYGGMGSGSTGGSTGGSAGTPNPPPSSGSTGGSMGGSSGGTGSSPSVGSGSSQTTP